MKDAEFCDQQNDYQLLSMDSAKYGHLLV